MRSCVCVNVREKDRQPSTTKEHYENRGQPLAINVRSTASKRSEHCRIHQESDPLFRYHIEHAIPRQLGGSSEANNLALACGPRNRYKGSNLSAFDRDAS